MSTTRDSQRSKFYEWEQAWHNQHVAPVESELTFEDAKEFVRRVCEKEGIRPPKVKLGRRDSGKAHTSVIDNTLTLPPWPLTHFTILHEIAHLIAYAKHKDKNIADHGPEYVYEFTRIMGKMFDIPQQEIIDHAKKYGVKCLQKTHKSP